MLSAVEKKQRKEAIQEVLERRRGFLLNTAGQGQDIYMCTGHGRQWDQRDQTYPGERLPGILNKSEEASVSGRVC